MRHALLTLLLLSLTTFSVGQQLPYVGPGQTFIFPNLTNNFITSSTINWALDTEESYSFADSKKIENDNVFNYVITKALSGKLKAYDLRSSGFEGFENSTYSGYDKFPNRVLGKDEINSMLSDSLKTFKFHEVFYLDNYTLNCQIISAAPMSNFATSLGISLGLQEIFFCCKKIKGAIKNEDLVHLKKIERVLNPDSVQNSKIVKQTYGLTLIQSIWYGASQGFIKLIDVKTNQMIEAKNVMNYSYLDSIQIPNYDSTGLVVGYSMRAGSAVFPNKLASSIQFVQDFYYDRRQNIFITTISNCYLFVRSWDEVSNKPIIEKRFRVL